MPLIITAEERQASQTGIKMVILGPAKIGKTSLVRTLDPAKTLVIDLEAGMLALDDCPVDSITVRDQAQKHGIHPWEFLRDLACLIAGSNPAVLDPNKPFSQQHYEYVVGEYGSRESVIGKYETIVVDSITDVSRLCFSWAKMQPEAFSDKKKNQDGTPATDIRSAYGLLGQQMVGADGIFNHLKHCPDRNLVFVGLLDQVKDDYGRTSWAAQVDGNKTKLELNGIFDQVISFVDLPHDGQNFRAFVCQQANEWGFPAGDRSGRLDVIEEPHLGKLLAKIRSGTRTTHLAYRLPKAGKQ